MAFDGGTATITTQENESWQCFKVIVPPGALGWDLRLDSVTSGQPQIVVRRESAPDQLGTFLNNNPSQPWSVGSATAWPTNAQITPTHDWTGVVQDAKGTSHDGRIFAFGLGNPLEPGNYFVGVRSASGSSLPIGYTLSSRGVGPGFAIPVTLVAFAGGSATYGPLPPREAAYFSVVVPPGAANWQFNATTTSGDVMGALQEDIIPSIETSVFSPTELQGGRKLQKRGAEQYSLTRLRQLVFGLLW